MRGTVGRHVAVAVLGVAALAIGLTLVLAHDASASHFRGGTMYAVPLGNDTVELQGRLMFKCSWGSWFPGSGTCAMGGTYQIGNAGTSTGLQWGDGSDDNLFVHVTYVNSAADWFIGTISDGSGTPGLQHTYGADNPPGQPYGISWSSNARIGYGPAPNYHMNNNQRSWSLQTQADLIGQDGAPNNPPRPFVPPIVFCRTSGPCDIPVPYADNDLNDTVHGIRLSTAAEATCNTGGDPCNFQQPGGPGCVPGSGAPASCSSPNASYTSASQNGNVTNLSFDWNTTGAPDAPNLCQALYSTQVMINDSFVKVPMDFFVRLCDATPPHWVSPPSPCSQTFFAIQGGDVDFDVEAASNDTRRVVTIQAMEMPSGGVFTGGTPAANPVSGHFHWSTAGRRLGDYLAVFYAEDDLGMAPNTCPVNIRILPPPTPDFTFVFTQTAPHNLTYDPVQFTDRSTVNLFGNPRRGWSWTFSDPNDGTPSNAQNPSHLYTYGTVPGTSYTACMTLTVRYSFLWNGTVCKPVVVHDRPPHPNPHPVSPTSGRVTFGDFGTDLDGAESRFVWDFGDGSPQVVVQGRGGVGRAQGLVAHTYGANGVYTVCVTATDDLGLSDKACTSVTINVIPPWVDTDLDGIADVMDNCPTVPNHDQADADGDGIGDACTDVPIPATLDVPPAPGSPSVVDADLDGIVDALDNCPFVPNPGQADRDGDGTGDFCDADLDGDGVPQWAPPNVAKDNCPTVANPDQRDTDHDGLGDACSRGVASADVGDLPTRAAARAAPDGRLGPHPALALAALGAAALLLLAGAFGVTVWAVRRWGAGR